MQFIHEAQICAQALSYDTVIKIDVTCEACGTAYYLPLEMKISKNFNPDRDGDEARAHAAPDKKFQQEITERGIVRCPSCKHLNNAMYRARTQGFKTDFWMSLIGIPLCLGVLLGTLWIMGESGSLFYVVAFFAGLGLLVLPLIFVASLLGLLGIWDFKTKKNGTIPRTEADASRSQKELLVKMVRG